MFLRRSREFQAKQQYVCKFWHLKYKWGILVDWKIGFCRTTCGFDPSLSTVSWQSVLTCSRTICCLWAFEVCDIWLTLANLTLNHFLTALNIREAEWKHPEQSRYRKREREGQTRLARNAKVVSTIKCLNQHDSVTEWYLVTNCVKNQEGSDDLLDLRGFFLLVGSSKLVLMGYWDGFSSCALTG